jgi:thiol-disulfide isomerase/thioredoxin
MMSMMGTAAPEFQDIKGWINSEPMSLASLRGKVVFLDFWTYSCGNCVRTLPYMRELHERYAREDLVVIGIHTPEFEFEKNPTSVTNAVEKSGLRYPIALDSNNTTWRLYGNHYWPRQTLVDTNGVVRYEHVGEGDYGEIDRKVKELLREAQTHNQP